MISTLSEALTERGYDQLTDVQEAVTAPELADADLLVSAQTGSGKTVGFGLAISHTLLGDTLHFGPAELPLALVIAPTRELAMQVQRELSWLYAKAGAQVVSCIGGMDARNERRALERGAHIVVGTPGRLRDHIMRGALDMTQLRAIVLDEADEMLDMGFREDLEFMLAEAPASKRTLLFSATVPPAIAEIAKKYQRDAVRVTTVSKGAQHADIAYQAVKVAQADAEHAIINLLRLHDAPASIVFANTRATVARLAARFANRGLSVVSLSGELSQDERSNALQSLRNGRARVCVATDVAARGIDLPNLDLVIHADLPMNTEALLHRSGRTGRAGRKGVSVLIVPDRAAPKANRLLKWAKITADWIHAPTPEEILALDEQRLRADPVWQDAPSEDEARFATELLSELTPEAIAVACLRLYRAGLSAPEDIGAPPAAKARPERAEFGPSAWFELSIGQDKRAEARWLLPLLCRAGGLDKGQIGRIKVQTSTTYVEIAESAAAKLEAQLGPSGVLEEDVTARRLDAPPEDLSAPRDSARPPRDSARPNRTEPRPRPADGPTGPRKHDGPRKAAAKRPEPSHRPEPRATKAADAPRKPRQAPDDARRTAAYGAAKPRDTKPGASLTRPKPARPDSAKRPSPRSEAPAPREKPTFRAGAADVSQRMERPGAKRGKPPAGKGPGGKAGFGKAATGKPGGGKPGGAGGNAPPRRKS